MKSNIEAQNTASVSEMLDSAIESVNRLKPFGSKELNSVQIALQKNKNESPEQKPSNLLEIH